MNRNTSETTEPVTPVRKTTTVTEPEENFGGPAPTPKVLLYTIPAIVLALFAWLVFSKVQARQRVRAETVTASSDAGDLPVSVTHPSRSATVQDLSLPGNIQAFVETPIYARTDGYLLHWYVDIGGKVKAGDLLATIDTPEVDQQLAQAEAAQLQAQANLDLAQTTANRWHTLLKSDGVSQQEVDQNDAALKARQADLNAAAANVHRLKDEQSFQKVTAPFDGILTARNVDIGSLISNGTSQALFRLAQINVLRVYVNVPESYTQDIHAGIERRSARSPKFPVDVFKGQVARSAGAIDPASKTLLTEVDVPNPKGELLPGAYAQVLFHSEVGHPAAHHSFEHADFPHLEPRKSPSCKDGKARSENHHASVAISATASKSSPVSIPSDEVILNPPDSLTDGAASLRPADRDAAIAAGAQPAPPTIRAERGPLDMTHPPERTLHLCSLGSP